MAPTLNALLQKASQLKEKLNACSLVFRAHAPSDAEQASYPFSRYIITKKSLFYYDFFAKKLTKIELSYSVFTQLRAHFSLKGDIDVLNDEDIGIILSCLDCYQQHSLMDSLLKAYREKILGELELIFENTQANDDTLSKQFKSFFTSRWPFVRTGTPLPSKKDALLNQLKALLAINWDFVKNSALSYTALPQDEVTLLLCDIALCLAEADEFAKGKEKGTSLSALEFLMPDLDVKSLHLAHPDLDRLPLAHVLNIPSLGLEVLPSPLSLFNSLGVNISLRSKQDLTDFMQLNASDIQELLQDGAIKEQVLEQIKDLDFFITFLLKTSPEKIHVLLTHLSSQLISKLNIDPPKFGQLLMPLDKRRFSLVFTRLYHSIINSTDNFSTVLKHIAPEQRMTFIERMQVKFPDLISTVLKFYMIRGYLNPEQKTALIERMQDKFPDIIGSYWDFEEIIPCLNPEQKIAFIERMQDKFPDIIGSYLDFRDIIGHLNPEQQTTLIQRMQAKFSDLIDSPELFFSTLEPLSPEQKTKVYQGMQDKLIAMIKSAKDFRLIARPLNLEERTALFELMKDRLLAMIKSASDFEEIAECLNPEQRTAIFEPMQDALLAMIKSASDFSDIAYYLNPEEKTMAFEIMQDKLPAMITSAVQLWMITSSLNSEQITILFERIEAQLPDIIKGNLRSLFTIGAEIHQLKALEVLAKDLPEIIKSHDELLDLFSFDETFLTQKCRMAILKALLAPLLETHFVKNPSQAEKFRGIYEALSQVQDSLLKQEILSQTIELLKSLTTAPEKTHERVEAYLTFGETLGVQLSQAHGMNGCLSLGFFASRDLKENKDEKSFGNAAAPGNL